MNEANDVDAQDQIAQLQERLFKLARGVYLGLRGLEEDDKLSIIQKRNRVLYRTALQLDRVIGRSETDVLLSQALQVSFLAYKAEQKQNKIRQ